MNDLQKDINQEVKENEVLDSNEVEVIEEVKEEVKEEKEMESIIECYTDYTYKARKTSQMYYLKVKSKYVLLSIIMIVALLALAIYSIFTKNYLFTGIGALFALYSVYTLLTQEKKVDKAIINFMKNHPAFRMTYKMDNEKIRASQIVEGKEHSTDFYWAYVQEVHEIENYYFLYLQGGVLIIDRDINCLQKGTIQELDDFIKKMCEFKPFKTYTKPFEVKLTYSDEEIINVEEITEEVENNESEDQI